MAITIHVDAAQRLRLTVISGDVGDRELVDAFRRSIAGPDFDPTLNGLVDLREVGKLDVTSNGIWELSQVLRAADALGGPRRVAIVAASDFQFGMARMAATLLSSGGLTTDYHAFRDLAEAHAWLDAGAPAKDTEA